MESSVSHCRKPSKPIRRKVAGHYGEHSEETELDRARKLFSTTTDSDDDADIVNMNAQTPAEVQNLLCNSESLAFSPLSLSTNCSIHRSASAMSSTSFKVKKKSTSSRLKASKSAVTFKEMRRIARNGFHHRHNSKEQFPPQPSIPERSQPMTEESLKEHEKHQVLIHETGNPDEDLYVELSNIPDYEKCPSDVDLKKENAMGASTTSATDATAQATVSAFEDKNSLKKSPSFVHSYPLCKVCGQKHKVSENHEYDYAQDIDDDFLCDICLQPFVDPYDTRCGHTFCCVCLKNYVRLKKSCPVDRKELHFIPSQCWQSSLVLRKLVDKMNVHCPNNKECQKMLPRTNLPAHLKERCPGFIVRCKYSMFGCSFKSRRLEQNEHETKCKFQEFKGNPIDLIYPNREKRTVELFRSDSSCELGLTIIGGNDTPIRNIIVQTIFPGGLIHLDGRIQAGDIIIEVNGEDFHSISHVEARTVLCKNSRLVRFTLLREKEPAAFDQFVTSLPRNNSSSKIITIPIIKPPSKQLGLKLASFDEDPPGVYIQDIAAGRVAYVSGLFQVGDRILKIANIDLTNGNTETAASIIQGAGEKFDMVVSRRTEDLITIANPWACDGTMTRNSPKTAAQTKLSSLPIPLPEIVPMKTSYKKKVISIEKAPHESLGIVVAGGINSAQGDLPIFVQDIQPLGLLDRDNRIQRADLLVEINGVKLNGLTHGQAVGVLKNVTANCEFISLIVVELIYSGKEEDFALLDELSGVHHKRIGYDTDRENITWNPSWKVWLAVPPQCRFPRNVVIRRNSWGEFGFCLCGGRLENENLNLPVLLKYVSPQSPASTQGHLCCGDEIVAVNGRHVTDLSHQQVIEMLKQSTNSVKLKVMSWPGSFH